MSDQQTDTQTSSNNKSQQRKKGLSIFILLLLLISIGSAAYWYLLPALGLVSAIGLSANLKSSQQIPVSVFAVLSYLEPTLLFLIAIFGLNTQVFPSDYFTYVPIWASLILLGINGLMKKRH